MKTLFADIRYQNFVFVIEYVYTPAIPGKFSGPPEDCYSDEPGEIEFISIQLAGSPFNLYEIISDTVIEKIEEEILKWHYNGEQE